MQSSPGNSILRHACCNYVYQVSRMNDFKQDKHLPFGETIFHLDNKQKASADFPLTALAPRQLALYLTTGFHVSCNPISGPQHGPFGASMDHGL